MAITHNNTHNNHTMYQEPLTKTNSRYFDAMLPRFEQLAKEIDARLNERGIQATVQPFDSGYYGVSVTYRGEKIVVVDQPGVIGLEDQSMPYIAVLRGGKTLLSVGPKYHERGFGDVGMREDMRAEAYAQVLRFFETN